MSVYGNVVGSVAASKPSATSVTLSASGWDSTSLTQTVTCSGILQDETAQLITVAPSSSSMTAVISSGAYCSGQGADSLTFTCTTVPTEALVFNVSWQDCNYITPPTLISFTFNGTSYQAEEGMIWSEWCESEYNTIGLSYDSNFVTYGGMHVLVDNSAVSPNVSIIANTAYNTGYEVVPPPPEEGA